MKHLSFAFITVSKVCTVMFLGTPPAQHVVRTDRKAIHRRWWGSWPEAAVSHLLHWGCHQGLLLTFSLRDSTAAGLLEEGTDEQVELCPEL